MTGIALSTDPPGPVLDAREWLGRSATSADRGESLQKAFRRAWEWGVELRLPPFPVMTARTIEYSETSAISGHGPWSVLKLGDNTNVDVLKPRNYAAGGEDNYRLRDFAINGNKAQNVSGSCLLSDGRRVKASNLYLFNAPTDNLRHVQSAADLKAAEGGMDSGFEWIWHWGAGRYGIYTDAHDASWNHIRGIANAVSSFYTDTGALATILNDVHNWGACERPFNFNASFDATNCQAEGGTVVEVRCKAGGRWTGGRVFVAGTPPNVPGFEIVENATELHTRNVYGKDHGSGGMFWFSGASAGSGSTLDGVVDGSVPTLAITGTPSGNIDTSRLRLRHSAEPGSAWPVLSQSSAETMTFDGSVAVQRVTGTQEVKKVTVTALPPGRTISLYFSSTAKLVDGENLDLNATFEGPGMITLATMEGKLRETARSKN